ncbi:MAG: hypothetical protein ABEJ72_08700 [Candidatus Aenigmatarchaeota archaeon]
MERNGVITFYIPPPLPLEADKIDLEDVFKPGYDNYASTDSSTSIIEHIELPGEIYERTAFTEGSLDYAEYSNRRYESRKVLDDHDIHLPGNVELAEMALQRIPDTVLTERFARESQEVLDLAERGEKLVSDLDDELISAQEGQEEFLEEAESYDIEDLIDIQEFTSALNIETSYIHSTGN